MMSSNDNKTQQNLQKDLKTDYKKMKKTLKERLKSIVKTKDEKKKEVKNELKQSKKELETLSNNRKQMSIFKKLVGIRFKLIGALLVPIAFIIVLGIHAYDKASDALIESYKDSAYTSVKTTGNYFDVIMNSVELRLTQLKSHDGILKYYSGAVSYTHLTLPTT